MAEGGVVMKRAHRRVHLVMWVLLLPALAVLLYAVLQARPSPPVQDDFPGVRAQERFP